MKIKEFVKKNHRVIKIAGIITAVVITDYIAYSVGEYNALAYAGDESLGFFPRKN